MSSALRRSGSAVAFYWEGRIADPRSPEFPEALRNRRFRTIENAASEEISVGWVTPADPTGETFELEDMDGGPATWLRVRVDKKVLSKTWLRNQIAAVEKLRGRKLSARERRELKDDLIEKTLPRVLPTTVMVDALLLVDRRQLLLFAGGKSMREAFGKLFFESFGVNLVRANPLHVGLRAGLDGDQVAELDRCEPIRWPNSGRLADELARLGGKVTVRTPGEEGQEE